MKLQILTSEQKEIEGYQLVKIDRNNMDLSSITNNSCESILASDVFDSFPASSAPEVINALVQKLRLNGELVIGGTEIRVFSNLVSNGVIPLEEASNMITNVQSMSSVETVTNVVKQLGLSLLSCHIDGVHFEVKTSRRNKQ